MEMRHFLALAQYAELKTTRLHKIVQKFSRWWELFGGAGLEKPVQPVVSPGWYQFLRETTD